jgi:hypothetical protein
MKASFARMSLFCSALFILFGCNNDREIRGGPFGSFQYKAYDTLGVAVVQGWLTLNISDSSHVDGEWHFTQVGTPKNVGPQNGDGRLQGAFHDSTLSVNLNPQFVDNNVDLTGRYDGKTFKGEWIWSGFPGKLGIGWFTAVQQ